MLLLLFRFCRLRGLGRRFLGLGFHGRGRGFLRRRLPGSAAVRTSVIVLIAVYVLGLVRAFVKFVRNSVAVVVIIRASVLILESVKILGFVRTHVLCIENAVVVVVEIRTAVLVLKSIFVLWNIGTLIHVVGNTVAVGIDAHLVKRSVTHRPDVRAALSQACKREPFSPGTFE